MTTAQSCDEQRLMLGSLRAPIFIFGMLQRCGTVMLGELIRLHPACQRVLPAEDNLLLHMPFLDRYVDSLFASWKRTWGVRSFASQALLRQCLGQGLLEFLRAPTPELAQAQFNAASPLPVGDKRMVTRTPSVRHADRVFEFFSEARVVVIVRDGRAVVESGIRSFGWNFEEAARDWAAAARKVEQMRRLPSPWGERVLVVRYEDLVNQLEAELPKILQHLQLDLTQYDMQQALQLPIEGSSTFGREETSAKSWERSHLAKTDDFRPLERFSHWSPRRHERFNHLAGEQLTQLGYEPQSTTETSMISSARNSFFDATWAVRQAARRCYWAIRGRVAPPEAAASSANEA